MKKLFMAVIALMMTISASAQFYIYCSDGNVIKVDSISLVAPAGTDTPDTPTEPEEPDANNHEYVDLGLSVKWATCNVGASKPEEYGNYFAWGETQPKDYYDWNTYKWCNDSYNTITKYNNSISYGSVDNKTQLELGDDAVRTNFGGSWRMPTYAELTELRENCIWTWTTLNGVYGYKVTSKKSGYTNKYIFLPAASYCSNSTIANAGSYGCYWSNTLYTDDPRYAWGVYFDSGDVYGDGGSRDCGHTVRPVLDVSGATPTPDEPNTPSAGIGTFSVSADKQVTFSKGNLQYTQSTNTWSFAENQYDYLGEANIAIDADVLADKVDLFGWSTATTNFGVSTSTSDSDYSGSFVDWGTNKIGNDAPNTWRTLTYDEWKYLLNNRNNASSLRGVAQVNGVNGLIFLPDNWTCPSGVTFKSGFHSNYGVDYYAAYQTFTAAEWSKLESAGAVFLPAAGGRGGTDVGDVQYYGYYWSATDFNSYYAFFLNFGSDEASMDSLSRDNGLRVRLVKDLQ